MPEMKSNFAVTCNLLSQYIKERGPITDLGIAAAAPRTGRPATMSYLPCAGENKDAISMDLFPQRAGFGPTPTAAETTPADFSSVPPTPPEKAQLTIFYGGKVLVFDNFPAEKAKDLMNMASKGIETPRNVAQVQQQGSAEKPHQPNASSLPLARSKSLHRFLEKRKDRIQAKAPYQASHLKAPAVKKEQEESPSWLGLGSQVSKSRLNECTG